VQEAKENYPRPKGTWMGQDDEYSFLNWGQAKYRKLVSYDPLSNIPIIYAAALSCTYRAFATTFEALKAPFF
jgi:hypothetical protein